MIRCQLMATIQAQRSQEPPLSKCVVHSFHHRHPCRPLHQHEDNVSVVLSDRLFAHSCSDSFHFRGCTSSPRCKCKKIIRGRKLDLQSFFLSQAISLLLPNPCGLGRNLGLISPTRNLNPETLNRDMFENCKFLDEKLNDVDCSVERDTRDYVGEKLAI